VEEIAEKKKKPGKALGKSMKWTTEKLGSLYHS
jgi:hypothetical protein